MSTGINPFFRPDKLNFSKKPLSPLVYNPIAASIAIIPLAKGLIRKSELQLEKPKTPINFSTSLVTGLKISPIVGFTVGIQMILENILTKNHESNGEKKDVFTNLKFSLLIGTATSPLIAIFNAQAMNMNLKSALKTLSSKQISMIALQESSFVAGMSSSDYIPTSFTYIKLDKKIEKMIKMFFSSFLGALIGHVPNTILTRSQHGLVTPFSKTLIKGSMTRSANIGLFSVFYHSTKKLLSNEEF
jgi:hypothetical protein